MHRRLHCICSNCMEPSGPSLEFLDATDTIKEKEAELIEKEREIKKEEELKTKR